MKFAQFTLITLVPFGIGLAIVPFDPEGKLLQYYPFRLGDVMLLLGACLLCTCAIQQLFQRFTTQPQPKLLLVSLLIVGFVFYPNIGTFIQQAKALPQFPNEQHQVDASWKDLSTWIRLNTPRQAVFASSPSEFVNFTWLTERATIAKFKLLPQTQAGILKWYERLNDLSGGILPQRMNEVDRTQDNRAILEDLMAQGYNRLTTAQVNALLQKYQATYFVARQDQVIDLPIAYRNDRYVLYEVGG